MGLGEILMTHDGLVEGKGVSRQALKDMLQGKTHTILLGLKLGIKHLVNKLILEYD